MRVPVLVTSALLVAALAGCGTAAPDPAATPATSSSPSASATPTPSTPSLDPSSQPSVPPPAEDDIPATLDEDPRVQAALADARGRAGVVPSAVLVAGYSKVTWNDGSLGCPQKGQAYTQATVDGELLLLRADQRVMSYHSGRGAPFTYCASPSDTFSPRT